ncbi:hypothetical protein ACFOD4_01695 [Pseudoroseomonas globiformis]|uniref:Uncharacterized protein n=1 Tax=Teichococcus globiformis TaxID=2307229 RepID=A0ABV7FWP2_9PROT
MTRPSSERLDWLADAGWTIGERHPLRRQGEPGAFMALAPDGRWCVVGDDLAPLVEQAWDHQYPAPRPHAPRPARPSLLGDLLSGLLRRA